MKRSLRSLAALAFRTHPIAFVAAWVTLASCICDVLNGWYFNSGRLEAVSDVVGLASIPIWLPLSLKFEREQKRIQKGHCVDCGYDLRASPDRCPECGAIPRTSAMTERAKQVAE